MTTTKTYVYATGLTATACGDCGISFGLPDDVYAARRTDGGAFYCPNGHRISWSENDNQRLKRELKQANDLRSRIAAERDQAEASRRAWKGQATKLRNRAAAGTCPFCGEHVYQLSRHVSRKHPDEASRPDEEPTT